MDHNSKGLWAERLRNQKYPLIGTNESGNGNGYHDRISFDIPYGVKEHNSKYDHWLFYVYFRDLHNALNPALSYWREEKRGQNLFSIENCSDEFRETFFRYLEINKRSYRNEFLDTIGTWGNYLVNHGRVIFEFVGWYDNSSNDFYAFELKILDEEYCKIKNDKIIFTAPCAIDQTTLQNKTVEIPKEKCIIIEWSKELGGYEFYCQRVAEIVALGHNHSSIEQIVEWKPGEMANKMKKWDENFNRLVSVWGTNHPLRDTTEYYQSYSYLKFKGTVIHLMKTLVSGIEQTLNILNQKLNEKSVLKFSQEDYNEKKYLVVKNKFQNGEFTFKELTAYLKHNY